MKKLCLLFAALFLMCAAAPTALAVKANEPVHIANHTYYDAAEKAFLYYVDDTTMQAIRCNVADGMITDQAVSIQTDTGLVIEVYLNGERLDSISSGSFQTPGEYVVMYMGGAITERVFSFTIVPEVCNNITGYTLPDGFEMLEAYLGEAEVPFESGYIPLTEAGEYTIRYRCTKTNEPYQLVLRTDFAGPVLSLEEVTDGFARGPVDISEANHVAVVNIFHDGEQIARRDVLTESGEYFIELVDEAGNRTTYSFTILIYFDGNSWLFFLMVLFACAGVIIYLLHARRHLRVR